MFGSKTKRQRNEVIPEGNVGFLLFWGVVLRQEKEHICVLVGNDLSDRRKIVDAEKREENC